MFTPVEVHEVEGSDEGRDESRRRLKRRAYEEQKLIARERKVFFVFALICKTWHILCANVDRNDKERGCSHRVLCDGERKKSIGKIQAGNECGNGVVSAQTGFPPQPSTSTLGLRFSLARVEVDVEVVALQRPVEVFGDHG